MWGAGWAHCLDMNCMAVEAMEEASDRVLEASTLTVPTASTNLLCGEQAGPTVVNTPSDHLLEVSTLTVPTASTSLLCGEPAGPTAFDMNFMSCR